MDTVVSAIPATHLLTHERAYGHSRHFAFLTSIALTDSVAIVTDLGYMPHGAVLSLPTGELIGRFPDEDHETRRWADPRIVGERGIDVVVWDTRTQRLGLGGVSEGRGRVRPTLVESALGQLGTPALLGDRVVFPGYFLAASALVSDQEGGGHQLLIGAPPFQLRAISDEPDMRGIVNSGSVAGTAEGTKFAIAHKHALRLQLVDLRMGEVTLALLDSEHSVRVSTNDRVPVFHDDHQLAYMGVAAGKELVYALYSGGRYRSQNDAPSTIHVFGWDGALLRVLELEYGVSSIAVSDDGRWLYGTVYDDGNAWVARWRVEDEK